MLSGLALIGVTVWLWRTRHVRWVWLVTDTPAAWMYFVSVWALVAMIRRSFTGGVNAGIEIDIESHRKDGGNTVLVFWLPLPVEASVGDPFSIVAGCDKSFDTCRKRFANQVNFRGFPHLPGSDFAYSYADGETEHDGGPLYD